MKKIFQDQKNKKYDKIKIFRFYRNKAKFEKLICSFMFCCARQGMAVNENNRMGMIFSCITGISASGYIRRPGQCILCFFYLNPIIFIRNIISSSRFLI